jgi:hypothetical protein
LQATSLIAGGKAKIVGITPAKTTDAAARTAGGSEGEVRWGEVGFWRFGAGFLAALDDMLY